MTAFRHAPAFALVLLLASAMISIGQKAVVTVTSDSALAELKSGNLHHVAHRYAHPHHSLERQRELTSGQHPHGEILSCSDSRVPPEMIFVPANVLSPGSTHVPLPFFTSASKPRN